MTNTKKIFKYLFIILIASVVFTNGARSKKRKSNFLDFEEVKSDLFLKNLLNFRNINKDDSNCITQLNEIKNGLTNYEQWAMRVVDSWGKLPPAIMQGNFYEFGGFSECLNNYRDDKLFDTQYCMGKLVFNTDAFLPPSPSIQSDMKRPVIQPRMGGVLLPEPGLYVFFGMCVPSACSMNFLEPILNGIIEQKVKNITVKLSSDTCQFEENISKWRTIDWATLGVFGTVFCLSLLSTCYDIFCTIYEREKTQILLAFSFYTNGMKLLSYKKSNTSDMMCIHGIRALSTIWVILGHSYQIFLLLPTQNKVEYPTFLSKYYNMLIVSGVIAVDTFFLLSGLLVSFSMLKHLEKTKGKLNVPLLYFHRYLRLTPLLGVSFLFTMSLLRFFGNGPLWPSLVGFLGEQCERYWWTTLLYVQNYVNPRDICFGHSWYLSVDMQLFWIAPIVVYSIYRFSKAAIGIWFAFIIGCVWCTIAVHVKYNMKTVLAMDPAKAIKAYYATHIRFSPWLIGVIAGYFFFKARDRLIRMPKVLNISAWLTSLALIATVVFANHPLQQLNSKSTSVEYGMYDALSRVGWAIALCYIIFSCVHNYGGPVNYFLSHPLWQPISRLCYAIYLLHFPVILVTTATMKTSPYFSEFKAFQGFIGNYILTVFVSIIATLAFESPIIVIEKFIFGPTKKLDRKNSNAFNEKEAIKSDTISTRL